MKISDYVAQFLRDQGIKHVFAITGGASVHLIDSIARTDGIEFICPAHEQAGAFAADAYARASGGLGCAIATSGPGATNLITGIAGAYFDSIPVIFITGQQSTSRMKGDTGVRQMGFQETDIVPMCRPITKYCMTVMAATEIRYALECAVHSSKEGRPGPVLVDIPDNLQREEVDPEKLHGYAPMPKRPLLTDEQFRAGVKYARMLCENSNHPVLVPGWGVRLAGAEKQFMVLAERLGFPICPTWAARDMIPDNHPLLAGAFGTHGTRFGNFTIQNSDFVLAIGTRLSTRETGVPLTGFARGAKLIMADIDPAEINKFHEFGRDVTLGIGCDAKDFIEEMLTYDRGKPPLYDTWLSKVQQWKQDYPLVDLKTLEIKSTINPYYFVEQLSDALDDGAQITVDTACAIAWMAQGFKFKRGQRMFHAFNNTPMGYALPGAIGVAFATGKPVTCVVGDGSLLMNIQEMVTAKRHNLPIKMFLLNNNGHSMVRQTQDDWLESRYHATSVEGGLGFPDFQEVAQACGWTTFFCDTNEHVADAIQSTLNHPGPVMCDVVIPEHEQVVPKVRAGYPNEDCDPPLPREEFLRQMIIKPMEISLEPRS